MKAKKQQSPIRLRIDSEVVRQIRKHARSESKTEVCGVLLGSDAGNNVEVSNCIAGVNAAQGGAHVTFTQETWEHIYKIKDKEYPDHRIVGWYHSHPGFGIFLSEHDTFIHENFFSSPGQVAWVYDPLSDEEGCFGWQGGRIVRLGQIDVLDKSKGEPRPEGDSTASTDSENWSDGEAEVQPRLAIVSEDVEEQSLQRLVSAVISHLSVLMLGFVLAYYVFPRIVVMAVPVDPITGRLLGPPTEVPDKTAQQILHATESADESHKGPEAEQAVQPATPNAKDGPAAAAPKDGDGHR